MRGGAGDDTLTGGSDDDDLTGGAGNDILNGGGGNDTASYALSKLGVTINLKLGTATGGDATGDTLTSIENLIGSSKNDVLTGDDNDNILTGGLGNDALTGGAGNDTFVIASKGDGTDTIAAVPTSTPSRSPEPPQLLSPGLIRSCMSIENFVGNGHENSRHRRERHIRPDRT